MPDAVAPFNYTDISDTVNKYARQLQKQGVQAIVVVAGHSHSKLNNCVHDETGATRNAEPGGCAEDKLVVKVSYNSTNPLGQKITSVTLQSGTPISRSATYTVAANSFIATGGDGPPDPRQRSGRPGSAYPEPVPALHRPEPGDGAEDHQARVATDGFLSTQGRAFEVSGRGEPQHHTAAHLDGSGFRLQARESNPDEPANGGLGR